jgi:hypothetical protein
MTAPDSQRVLSESQLAQLAKVKRPRRAGWAKQGLLRAAPSGGKYGELDAVELAAFAGLVKELDFADAVLAWHDVRHELRDSALMAGEFLVLYDHQTKDGFFGASREALAAHLMHGHQCELVDLTVPVAEIRRSFRKMRDSIQARRTADKPRAVRARSAR